jgi:hypothetical protein
MASAAFRLPCTVLGQRHNQYPPGDCNAGRVESKNKPIGRWPTLHHEMRKPRNGPERQRLEAVPQERIFPGDHPSGLQDASEQGGRRPAQDDEIDLVGAGASSARRSDRAAPAPGPPRHLSWFSVNWSPGHARIASGVARPRASVRRAARRTRAASSLRSRSSQTSVCRPARRSCGVTYPIALCSRRVL